MTREQWVAFAYALSYVLMGAAGVVLGIVFEKWDRRQRA